MKKGEPWITLAYDESNHSRYPEICVVAVSNFTKDLVRCDREEDMMGKIRKDHSGLGERLEGRDYAFLDFSATAYELIPTKYKLGIVLANLIRDRPIDDHLDIYVDGEWYDNAIKNARDILSESVGLGIDCIEINYGAALDKKIPLVNIADETAHWIYGQSPAEWMKEPIKSHKQELYLREFLE